MNDLFQKLLMVKAAEDLKRQQLVKEQERQKALAERTIALPNVDTVDDKGKLEAIYNDLFKRVCQLEEEKYDINQLVSRTEAEINALTIDVNDLRGKFVKPSLKKVSKYDNKFKKMAQTSENKSTEKKPDFRANLKIVKKDVMEEITNVKKKDDKPDWSKKPTRTDEEVHKEEKEIEIPKNETETVETALEEAQPEQPEEEEEYEDEEEAE
uniref:Troponin I n=1 Tax=Heterorhabditis bacteriophora TaxID=37862 RepID=A0A1I7XQZ0_HETBA